MGVTLAFCISVVGFYYYDTRSDQPVVIIFGMATLCDGVIGLFHLLSLMGFVSFLPSYEIFEPFTWALSRTISALIFLIGTLILIQKHELKKSQIKLIAFVFMVLSIFSICLCSITPDIPMAIYPDAFVKRPWDIIALIFFIFHFLCLLTLKKKYSGVFLHALMIAVIPQIATQLYAIFGCSFIGDFAFFVSQFLRNYAYFILLFGLLYQLFKNSTDEYQLRKDLELQNCKLKQSNDDLEKFAYVASHDLQQPLRTIGSFLEIIREDLGDHLTKETTEYIGYVTDASQHMRKLVDGLLEYSRVQTRGKDFVIIDLNLMMENIRKDLGSLLSNSPKSKIVTIGKLPFIKGDPDQIYRVFLNLITNGLKFHKKGEGSTVVIRNESRKDGKEIISIEDNGIGINPEDFNKVFIIFTRLNNSSDYPGTGIGLAISKRMVNRHGGEVWVNSLKGQGSTFYVSLPSI
jgi:signal transduction histidine kinase